MSEIFTQTQYEDAIASTDTFLQTERGVSMDGFEAGLAVESLLSPDAAAEQFLTEIPHPRFDGLYVPLSKLNAAHYTHATAVLAGRIVLVPSAMLHKGESHFYPAVVSPDSLTDGELRLHVLQQPYRQHIRKAAAFVLSAAGQSETPGVGRHSNNVSDGVEAEHFATLLTAGMDESVAQAWRSGVHSNHTWRQEPDNSVTTTLTNKIHGNQIPQRTITVSQSDIASGKALLLWHEGLRNQDSGAPESATHKNALVAIQGLSFLALREKRPLGIATVKSLLQ
jgi:hypothetical protein